MVGWINADEAVTGLSWPAGLLRESVIDALNQVTDYTAGGLVPSIDWTRQHLGADPGRSGHPRPRLTAGFVKVVDAEFEVQGDPAPGTAGPARTGTGRAGGHRFTADGNQPTAAGIRMQRGGVGGRRPARNDNGGRHGLSELGADGRWLG